MTHLEAEIAADLVRGEIAALGRRVVAESER
jgi:hypothetical protein